MKNKIHGPCGNWCLVDSKGSKHFPNNFNEETSLNKNSFVTYRRRNMEKTMNVQMHF